MTKDEEIAKLREALDELYEAASARAKECAAATGGRRTLANARMAGRALEAADFALLVKRARAALAPAGTVKHWCRALETNRAECGASLVHAVDWVADWCNATCPGCLSRRPGALAPAGTPPKETT